MPQAVDKVSSVQDETHCVSVVGEPAGGWYATCTRSRHEKRAAQYLAQHNVEHFLPLYRTTHNWKNRTKAELELPLFPGYLFVRIREKETFRILEAPGVVSFVGSKLASARMSEDEINAMRSGLHLRPVTPFVQLAVGDRVRIKSGPLAGLTGVLLRHATSFRVVLTVNLISQSVAVEVSAEEIELCPSPKVPKHFC